MSASSLFQSVVYYGSQGIAVLSPKSKGQWTLAGNFGFEDAVPAKVQKLLSGSVLVLVSDTYCGHLQVLFPNKKSELSDEHIAEVLEKEYDIDTSAYEFASQKFSLSREQVQMSISGVERATYQKVQTWLEQFSPKKAWVMPFGWFVSALKSVEPVLLAIGLSEDEVLVSHHYLGVDDAREISVDDLNSYIKSRKNERKETHLLYIQAEEGLQEKITKSVGDTVATHPLIEEANGDSVLATVVAAVWKKGEDALAELLHFEVEASGSTQPVSAKATKEDESESESLEKPELDLDAVNESEVVAASDLPKPQPPEEANVEEVEEADTEPEEVEPELESDSEVTVVESVATTVIVADTKPDESDREEPVKPMVEESIEEEKTESPKIKEVPPETSPFADLQSSGVARASESRYVEVPKKSSWKTAVLVFLGVVFLTSIIGGAIFWSQQSPEVQTPLLPATSPTPTPIIEAEPEASESAEVTDVLTEAEKEDLSVLVLNATGIAGLAGKTRTELQNAGWSDIDVGNATGSYDDAVFVYTETDKVITTLENDLEIEISEASSISESGSDEYDVVFIIADEVPWQ